MVVKIKLGGMGQKKVPFYRTAVVDLRSLRDSKFIAEIDTYDPTRGLSVTKFDEETAKKWLAAGVQPAETVGKLLKTAGIQQLTMRC